ncbi:MAG: hypothetical protein KC486_06005 [Myxococcales bacterium]|nr:hypothetical protein [Myxococcales bacterium]
MRDRRPLLVLGAVTAAIACAPTPAPDRSSTAGDEATPAPAVDDRRCKPAPGTSGAPKTIDEAIALANGLPFPVTAECFVEALDRPLQIEATKSERSLQKAVGARSPRVFIWGADTLVMSIVLDGDGRDLIEFGQFITPKRSIKAELKFPLAAPVTAKTAYDRVRNPEHPNITVCFVCHDREKDVPELPGARSSLALRPRPSTIVAVDSLRAEYESCDRAAEPARCAYLEALMSHGPVEHRAFDEELRVF